ncbi:hypothetical protein BGZ80_005605 [Entomortierella chlamydospora]|uniref:Uncharacterized protein n=1 Tax=Entomortierella chlamydospora TaxID=101097 RepID=A0A9P6T268_9FUNG|nr:hypothetical protein BGZ79_004529 [Entomortierella chlamydospora]KAG0019564.1 hypothetical protein BGZ80_005605 [Entomortierella chlamydospora]
MSSLYNRIYDEGLGLLGPREQHRIRSRRLSGRKHQLHRRETLTAADLLYTLTLTSCSSSRSRFLNDMKACTSTLTAASKHHQTDITTNEPEFPSRLRRQHSSSSDDVSSIAQAHVGIESTVAFAGCRSQQLRQQEDQEYGSLPLPPVVLRMDMPGSPFSLYPPNNETEVGSEHGPLRSISRSALLFGGVRAMGAGGRSGVSGGGGRAVDNPVPSGGVSKSGDNDGDEGGESEGGKPVPSAYTFRRRNAIVEGSEEAPRSDDFPDSA